MRAITSMGEVIGGLLFIYVGVVIIKSSHAHLINPDSRAPNIKGFMFKRFMSRKEVNPIFADLYLGLLGWMIGLVAVWSGFSLFFYAANF